LSPLAQRVGAANVFWHEQGELIGDNSDVGGAEMVLRALLGDGIGSARLALIGAGGSAASVLCAAERCGIPAAVIYNRNVERAEQLASRFAPRAEVASTVSAALSGASIVVNATPVGLRDRAFPVPVEELPPGCAVFDLVYTRGETAWVTAARQAGHRATDGEGMLIEQGAIAFEQWFGIKPDRNAMWKAIH
jgi:shikimate dehydrogenase